MADNMCSSNSNKEEPFFELKESCCEPLVVQDYSGLSLADFAFRCIGSAAGDLATVQ